MTHAISSLWFPFAGPPNSLQVPQLSLLLPNFAELLTLPVLPTVPQNSFAEKYFAFLENNLNRVMGNKVVMVDIHKASL